MKNNITSVLLAAIMPGTAMCTSISDKNKKEVQAGSESNGRY